MNANRPVGGPLHSKAPLTRQGLAGAVLVCCIFREETNSDGWKERNADH
jgi:hypothetical protein